MREIPTYFLGKVEVTELERGRTLLVTPKNGTPPFFIGYDPDARVNGNGEKKNGEDARGRGSIHCRSCDATFRARSNLYAHLAKDHGYVGGNQHGKGKRVNKKD